MLKIVTTLLCVYMLVRCVLPLRCTRPLKMLLALLVLLVGFRLHIFSLLYATFNPELPRWVLEGTPRPRILMAHKPELFHQTAPDIDLQLSGHTHGGLALLLDQGVALFNGGFVRGWYARDKARLYVGPGSGLWGGFPLRLGVPSEILLLVLRAPQPDVAS